MADQELTIQDEPILLETKKDIAQEDAVWHYEAWLIDEKGEQTYGIMEEFLCEYSESVAMARAYYRASKILEPKPRQAIRVDKVKQGRHE